MTAVMLGVPLLALSALAPSDAPENASDQEPNSAHGWRALFRLTRALDGPLLATLLVAALALPAMSSLQWLVTGGSAIYTTSEKVSSRINLLHVDCRKRTAATTGEKPQITYAEQGVFYVYAGCHPVYTYAPSRGHWAVKTHLPEWGVPAFRALADTMLAPNDPLRVVCLAEAHTGDGICEYARQHSGCVAMGTYAVACELSATDRAALLGLPAR
jgi:hypothetical protein